MEITAKRDAPRLVGGTLPVTDAREGALAVDVLVREESGEAYVVRSAGLTAGEAVHRAVEGVEALLGGGWAMEEWWAA